MQRAKSILWIITALFLFALSGTILFRYDPVARAWLVRRMNARNVADFVPQGGTTCCGEEGEGATKPSSGDLGTGKRSVRQEGEQR